MEKDKIEEAAPKDMGKLNRSALMDVTTRLIKHLDKKSISGRLSESEVEKMRDSKTRLLIEAVKTHGSLLKDEALETIELRLKALEDRLK